MYILGPSKVGAYSKDRSQGARNKTKLDKFEKVVNS